MKHLDPRALSAHWRYLVATAAVIFAFAAAYAAAGYLLPEADAAANAAATEATANASGSACTLGGGCRRGAGTPVSGAAITKGGVQRLGVAVGAAGYTPDVLQLQAGVPAEITFSQSSGCTDRLVSDDLGFDADLTNGPQTVRLPALQEGTYAFSCGMRMAYGSIVVTAVEAGP